MSVCTVLTATRVLSLCVDRLQLSTLFLVFLQLEAIKQTKVDMEVFLGIYPIPDDDSAYERQRDTIKEALQTYGADHVAGITVGNEFILK